MTTSEIRSKYLAFFQARGHVVVPSASLVPENDPTTLFTGSGMQPLLPYLLGSPHPAGKCLVNSQKCFRSMDIEEVGDNRHTTFFEMLGNWSLGDYFKEEQLPWVWEFFTKEIGLPQDRLWVTCFAGDEKLNLPKDEESAEIWKKLGVPESRIRFYGAEKNWWSRTGAPGNMPAGEPGGPDSEVFYEFTNVAHDMKFGKECHPNCDCGRFLEIGNSVFMEYVKNADGSFAKLPQKNVDFGGGLERIAAASANNPDVFAIDLFEEFFDVLDSYEGVSYTAIDVSKRRALRIVADHLRAAAFLIADGVLPSNTDRGYVLRRLIRRAVRYGTIAGIAHESLSRDVSFIECQYLCAPYTEHYFTESHAVHDPQMIIAEEIELFKKTLAAGMREFGKLSGRTVSAEDAFTLFSTHGFPLEMTTELAHEKGMTVDERGFEELKRRHQERSRAGSEQKFKGGLADAGEQTTKLHTATHLMLAGLRKFLGEHVHQAGSNITAERTRFDFTHPEKVSRDILDKVEAYVNEAIVKSCDVVIAQIPKEQARADGVEGSFWEKYPDTVNVYMVKCADGSVYSRELCGGPHVTNTGNIGRFRILKEEASSAGVRRVKAVLE